MPSPLSLLPLLLAVQLHLLLLTSAVSPHAGLRKNPSGAARRRGAESGAREEGEPCGVYTLPCGRGLRCFPPDGDASPLRALLQGRGACRSVELNVYSTTTAGSQVPVTKNTEKGPCRKLLMSALQKLEMTLIRSHPDLYIPNCDRNGSFKRKQCLASHGMQRGRCWCVDEKGHRIPSRTRGDGPVICSSS
ncbi:insulin-like growth factor-binding protein 6a [Trichomycterus rosablanca]|uniref:insulin-like growth factor-binding protein 6a n=1 Tax=Trichomycterus rosablanca TaxID=2290929 RepID=UPI002F35E3D5